MTARARRRPLSPTRGPPSPIRRLLSPPRRPPDAVATPTSTFKSSRQDESPTPLVMSSLSLSSADLRRLRISMAITCSYLRNWRPLALTKRPMFCARLPTCRGTLVPPRWRPPRGADASPPEEPHLRPCCQKGRS